MSSKDIFEKGNSNEKRPRSQSSSCDEVEPLPKKPCSSEYEINKDESARLNISSDSNDLRLVLEGSGGECEVISEQVELESRSERRKDTSKNDDLSSESVGNRTSLESEKTGLGTDCLSSNVTKSLGSLHMKNVQFCKTSSDPLKEDDSDCSDDFSLNVVKEELVSKAKNSILKKKPKMCTNSSDSDAPLKNEESYSDDDVPLSSIKKTKTVKNKKNLKKAGDSSYLAASKISKEGQMLKVKTLSKTKNATGNSSNSPASGADLPFKKSDTLRDDILLSNSVAKAKEQMNNKKDDQGCKYSIKKSEQDESSDSDVPLQSLSSNKTGSKKQAESEEAMSNSKLKQQFVPLKSKKKVKLRPKKTITPEPDTDSDCDSKTQLREKVDNCRTVNRNEQSHSGSDSDLDSEPELEKDQKKKTDPECTSDSGPDSDLDSGKDSEKNVVQKHQKKKTTGKKIKDKENEPDSSSHSGSNSDLDSKPELERDQKEKTDPECSSDSGPDSDLDSGEDSGKKVVQKHHKKKTTGKKIKDKENESGSRSDSDLDSEPELEKKLSMEKKNNSNDSKERSEKDKKKLQDLRQKKSVAQLKKYINVAGIRVKYATLWEGCKSHRARVARLKSVLINAGITGRPTLEKCKKFKREKETEQELAELSKNVIINKSGRALRRRGDNILLPPANNEPTTDMKRCFQRIRAVFDSDSE